MKKSVIIFLLTAIMLPSLPGQSSKDRMPVTTNSKQALILFDEAMKYFERVDMAKAYELLVRALDEDPDFFMANYQLAMYHSWSGNLEQFREATSSAINCTARISKAEELLKSAITGLRNNINADVTEFGKKLVEMYPRDENSYNNLVYFQSFINDTEGQLETLNKALGMVRNPAPFYNQLGYVYMSLDQNEKAEAAFDKYIELDPKNPNVYDSKGDFYMYIKDYKRAYESYMKASSIDAGWSSEKARRAKQLYENYEGKRLEIIPL